MIDIEKVTKSFEEVTAVKEVTLQIGEGELFGLIGPDGAGKSTLLRMLTSLLIPDSGTITVNNLDVVNSYRKIRNIVGYMPGRFSLYTDLSVEENLQFYATVFGTTIRENYSLIRDVYSQIEPYKNRLAGKLSGGMKQKLALSCALIHRPQILVLDEPTTGVDAVSRKEFWDLLKGLKEHGITILVSTPYMDEAQLCDRIALMQKGEVLSTNTPGTINKSYPFDLYEIKSESTYRLIQLLNRFENTRYVFPFGQNVHYTDKNKQIDYSEIEKYLTSEGLKDIEIRKIAANTEDVFMHLMQNNKTESKDDRRQ